MKTLLPFLRKEAKAVFSVTLLLAFGVIFISANLFEENNYSGNNMISPEWNQFNTVSQKDSITVGTPVQGEPGITETVKEIMEREAMLPADYYTRPKPIPNPFFESELEVRPESTDPNSPQTSQWPMPDGNKKNLNLNQTDNPQTIGTSFLAMNVSVSGFIPPDSQGDVGPAQVLTCSNGRIRVYSKAGVLGGLNSDVSVFFNSVRNGSTISDTHIRYDRLTGKWFVIAINTQAAPNRVVIAVSSGSTITDATSFTFFQFSENLPGAISGFADYPTLGVDKYALYIGMNMFNAAGTSFLGTNGYVINKANLIANILTTTAFTLFANPNEGPYTPQGVEDDDPTATEGYFIGVSSTLYGRLIIKRVTTPGGVPGISTNLIVTTPSTTAAINVQCLGTSAQGLDVNDWRLFAAEIHKNKITGAITLWTAHHFQVDNTGVANNSGGRLGLRWYEISNLTSSPNLVQSGTLYDPSANPRSFLFPSVAMSGQGHMAIGSSIGGAGTRAEISVAGRFRTDALGTNQAYTLAQSSSTAYNLIAGDGRIRWGDYSQTVVDPNDDQTMWTFQEYCDANNSWGVRAIQLKAPVPATPSASSVTNIASGQSSVTIIITGTAVSGSEFFDPGADAGGPGFSNHISATITGDVTVNSVTFTDPTHVSLNISTVGSPAGFKNITVINPDGQTATGNNLINITTVSAAPCEDFSTLTFPPPNLNVEFTGTDYWTRENNSAYGIGSGSAKFNFYNASQGTVQSLYSNNFAATAANTYLTFDEAYAPYTDANFGPDTLLVESSANSGSTYTTLATLIGRIDGTGELNTAPPNVNAYSPANSEWRPKIYSLPVGTNKVRLRAKSGFGNNLYLDNVCVQTLPAPVSNILCDMPEGFYRSTPSPNVIQDTIRMYLKRNDFPNVTVDSAKMFIENYGCQNVVFNNALNGSYHLVYKHRNSIETWTNAGVPVYSRGSTFTNDLIQFNSIVYGNNQAQVDPFPFYGNYGGDIDRNNFVDLNDLTLVSNDASLFLTGYLQTDVTGDNITDLVDMLLTYNNAANFVQRQAPPGAAPIPQSKVQTGSKKTVFENEKQRKKYEAGISQMSKLSQNEMKQYIPNWGTIPSEKYLNKQAELRKQNLNRKNNDNRHGLQ